MLNQIFQMSCGYVCTNVFMSVIFQIPSNLPALQANSKTELCRSTSRLSLLGDGLINRHEIAHN